MKTKQFDITSRVKQFMLIILFLLSPSVVSAQCPDGNHPHMIDLGLPGGVKWACCNVGAAKPEDFGSYYAFGETEEKGEYTEANYQLKDRGDLFNRIKDEYGAWDYRRMTFLPQYDVAHVKWGGNWSMPTRQQFNTLFQRTFHEKVTKDGVDGWLFIGFNGNSIFLPAGGVCGKGEFRGVGDQCHYWTSTAADDNRVNYGVHFYFGSNGYNITLDDRYKGQLIRPVCE